MVVLDGDTNLISPVLAFPMKHKGMSCALFMNQILVKLMNIGLDGGKF